MPSKQGKNQEIRNILAVLATAVISAILLVSFFLYSYGPSGRYEARNALLEPSIMDQINYQDMHPGTGRKVRFYFDHIEFSSSDVKNGKANTSNIPLEIYQEFYQIVSSEYSLHDINHEIEGYFFKPPYSVLTIHMRTNEGGLGSGKVFQVVQFVPEDYFRVQLHGSDQAEWAYFYQRGLYRKMIDLFSNSPKL